MQIVYIDDATDFSINRVINNEVCNISLSKDELLRATEAQWREDVKKKITKSIKSEYDTSGDEKYKLISDEDIDESVNTIVQAFPASYYTQCCEGSGEDYELVEAVANQVRKLSSRVSQGNDLEMYELFKTAWLSYYITDEVYKKTQKQFKENSSKYPAVSFSEYVEKNGYSNNMRIPTFEQYVNDYAEEWENVYDSVIVCVDWPKFNAHRMNTEINDLLSDDRRAVVIPVLAYGAHGRNLPINVYIELAEADMNPWLKQQMYASSRRVYEGTLVDSDSGTRIPLFTIFEDELIKISYLSFGEQVNSAWRKSAARLYIYEKVIEKSLDREEKEEEIEKA